MQSGRNVWVAILVLGQVLSPACLVDFSDNQSAGDAWIADGPRAETGDGGIRDAAGDSGRVSCGNGVLEEGEACDDGNRTEGDGCDAQCTVEPGWECHGSPSRCAPVCGDGLVVGDEECDDGNQDLHDGCPDGPAGTCRPAVCGDGFVWNQEGGTETCDGTNLGGKTCADFPPNTDGVLVCQGCSLDTSGCFEACSTTADCDVVGQQCVGGVCRNVGDTCDVGPTVVSGYGIHAFVHDLQNLSDDYDGLGCGEVDRRTDGLDRVYAVPLHAGDALVAWLSPVGWDGVLYLSTACPLAPGGPGCPVGWDRSPVEGGKERLDYVATSDGTVYLVVDGPHRLAGDLTPYRLSVSIDAGTREVRDAGDVIITEIAPDMGSEECEWLEIYNPHGRPMNLRGSELMLGVGRMVPFFAPLVVRPGEYLVVANSADRTRNCGLRWVSWADPEFDLRIGNWGVGISTGALAMVDSVPFTSSWPYSAEHAMYLCTNHLDESDNDHPANWREDTTHQYAPDHYGTPADEAYETDANPGPCN